MTDNARNDAPAVTEKKSSRRSFRRKKPWHQGRGGSTQNGQSNKQGKPQPKIFFCGDPHGEFDYINKTVEKYRPDAIVILGDLQPPDDLETLLAPTLAITQVWWIPGNHDTDCEEYYDRLCHVDLFRGTPCRFHLPGRYGIDRFYCVGYYPFLFVV